MGCPQSWARKRKIQQVLQWCQRKGGLKFSFSGDCGIITRKETGIWQWRIVLACSVAQMCLTLCDPMDCSPPGSSIYGILQARIVPFPSPGDLPNPGIKQTSPALAGRFFTTERPGKYPSYLSAIELKDRENSKLVISQLLLETKGAHNHSNLVQFTSACINA